MDKSDVEAWVKVVAGIMIMALFLSIKSCVRGGSNYQQQVQTGNQWESNHLEREFEQRRRERQQEHQP